MGCHRRLQIAILCLSVFFSGYFLYPWLYEKLHGHLDCFADEKTLSDIRKIVTSWDSVMEELNLTRWLDFGTLLGAHRFGDLIPWDHDGDLCFLWKDETLVRSTVATRLRSRFNITMDDKTVGRPPRLFLGDSHVQVDLFAFASYEELNLVVPEKKKPRTLTRANHRVSPFMEENYGDVDPEFVLPTRRCVFARTLVSCPRNPDAVLRIRYPNTYWSKQALHIPFKLQCYINPWNLLKIIPSAISLLF